MKFLLERIVMKKVLFATVLLSLAFTAAPAPKETATPSPQITTDAYQGWQLAVQMWSFNRFKFYDALDKVAALGVDP